MQVRQARQEAEVMQGDEGRSLTPCSWTSSE